MDWLRRNWPDLLIGVALVAVIAGIIATLISGGSFFPAGNRTVETPNPGSTPLTSNAAPPPADQAAAADQGDAEGAGAQGSQSSNLTSTASGPAAGGDEGEGASAAVGAGVAQPSDTAAGAATEGDAGAVANDQPSSASGLPVAVLPPGQTTASSSQASQAAAGAGQAQQPGVSSLSSTPSGSAAPAASAQASAVQTTIVSASNTPDAPYRVSVGAYANRDNAQRQAEAFAAAGYPVFIGVQGDLNIVLVGPYDTESEARAMADRISASAMGVADPTVYEFEADGAAPQSTVSAVANPAAASGSALSSSVSSSVGATTSQASGAQAAAGAESVAAGAAANDDTLISTASADTAGVRYLQAGAYGTRESSLPQRSRLEGLGFVVTERLESDLVKLLIGPFDPANLENAQSRLEAAGIASFPR